VRVKGFVPEEALIDVVLVDASGTEQARQQRMLTLQASGDAWVAYGFAPRIEDCCALAEQEVLMQVRVEDSAGKIGTDERRVTAGPCLDRNTNQTQCP
jgi:hypothetical protein